MLWYLPLLSMTATILKNLVLCSQKTPRLLYKEQSVYPLDNSRLTATGTTSFTVKRLQISPTKCAYLLNVCVCVCACVCVSE
jgi:hypothetical protein